MKNEYSGYFCSCQTSGLEFKKNTTIPCLAKKSDFNGFGSQFVFRLERNMANLRSGSCCGTSYKNNLLTDLEPLIRGARFAQRKCLL